MTARILVVDDVPANVRLLETRLSAEYYEVLTATNGAEALEICETGKVDVVLLDVMMPGMDGFEVCRRIKADPATQHVPVVMVTALDQVSDRIRGLQAGADDFLTKPVNDLQLMTRVKSLARLKALVDELRLRAATTRNIGLEELLSRRNALAEGAPKVLLVEDRPTAAERLTKMLRDHCDLTVGADPQVAFFQAVDGNFDCVVISTSLNDFDPLRLCAQLRALDRTRFLPIILIAGDHEQDRLVRAMEMGVNDYVVRPVDQHELVARVNTQVRRKRYNDQLRASLAETIEMAVTDPLTGLSNRRYLDNHLTVLFEKAQARQLPLSVMIADIDRFKSINDTHGHDAGDAVLREFATRLRQNIRGVDLVSRLGGEEFVVVMPDTSAATAKKVAERIRKQTAQDDFEISKAGDRISVTVSVGVASLSRGADSIEDMMKRADKALYEAKNSGRNCVVAAAA